LRESARHLGLCLLSTFSVFSLLLRGEDVEAVDCKLFINLD